ncbi:MAG: hypothetical protein ACLFVO_12120 [Chloroflexaceae bacterium]
MTIAALKPTSEQPHLPVCLPATPAGPVVTRPPRRAILHGAGHTLS